MKIAIFVDTSFLHGTTRQDDAWKEILKYSQEEKIILYFPSLVKEEFNSKKRDCLAFALGNIQKNINEFERIWNKNIFHDFLPPLGNILIHSEQTLYNHLKNGMNEFIKTYKIKVLKPEIGDWDAMLTEYFWWKGQFARLNKTDPNIRKKRREHIPDAVMTAMSSRMKDTHKNIYWLTTDGITNCDGKEEPSNTKKNQKNDNDNFPKLTEVLEKKGFTVFSTSQALLKQIKGSFLPEPAEDRNRLQDNFLKQKLEESDPKEIEKDMNMPPTGSGSSGISVQGDISLRDRICGYLSYFAPVTEETLIQFLSRHREGTPEIGKEIKALRQKGLLQCTHHGLYIPVHDAKDLYEQAAKKITPEILQYMEENSDE